MEDPLDMDAFSRYLSKGKELEAKGKLGPACQQYQHAVKMLKGRKELPNVVRLAAVYMMLMQVCNVDLRFSLSLRCADEAEPLVALAHGADSAKTADLWGFRAGALMGTKSFAAARKASEKNLKLTEKLFGRGLKIRNWFNGSGSHFSKSRAS